ncbi:MAG: hypothetical protein EO766_12045 [Hydrotalea sp. AMD]|uniref:hypothetical protein n=1 Tax=Hydrotalea sp. AMD TaxID=2501297 RepID=UPI001027E9E6|nr:hypothetical protein [Hydrotalea sp. AMD]RWZ87250.1 MAG: hypothetical protein EO766_12045 [Hydrotalea sp. AMD]
MKTVPINTALLQYVIAYLKTDPSKEDPEVFEKTWKVGIQNAIPELEATLEQQFQPHVEPGYKQIQSNPRRTETGMGPLLNTNSEFL